MNTQVVHLSPDEARLIHGRLFIAVKEDDGFTDPREIALAIQAARKMVPLFSGSESDRAFAEAALDEMQAVSRALAEAGRSDDELAAPDVTTHSG